MFLHICSEFGFVSEPWARSSPQCDNDTNTESSSLLNKEKPFEFYSCTQKKNVWAKCLLHQHAVSTVVKGVKGERRWTRLQVVESPPQVVGSPPRGGDV